MIERRKIFSAITVVTVLVCSVVVYQLLKLPSPKNEPYQYVLGTTAPKNATSYFEHVSNEQTVEVATDTLKSEGLKYVDVKLNEHTYKVLFNIIKPNIDDVVTTTNSREKFAVGESYAKFFKISDDLMDDVTFSTNSTSLETGDTTVTISAFGQTKTQALTVVSADSTEGKLTLNYDFSQPLQDVVTAYLTNNKLTSDKISLVYQNLKSQQRIAMNEKTVSLAGTTLDVPLAMLAERKIQSNEIDATNAKTLIDNMLRLSSATSEKTLISLLGGDETTYKQLNQFGQVDGNVATIIQLTNQTTADYFGQVMNYLYQNKSEFDTTITAMKQASMNKFFSRFLGEISVWHKPSAIGQVINDVAIVEYSVPYAVVLFTRDLTSTQFVELSYLIHKWHRQQ